VTLGGSIPGTCSSKNDGSARALVYAIGEALDVKGWSVATIFSGLGPGGWARARPFMTEVSGGEPSGRNKAIAPYDLPVGLRTDSLGAWPFDPIQKQTWRIIHGPIIHDNGRADL